MRFPNPRTLAPLCILLLAACSGGDDNPEVSFFDSGVPDAVPVPDAEPCQLTECGDLCVDTSADPLHCGGCNMACQSPGQICSGALPCECPANFVPADVGGSLDQVQLQSGFYIGISPQVGAGLDVVAVVWDLSLSTNVEYDFADSVSGLMAPALAAGQDVDISTFMAHTPYAAFQGTIIFDTICETGASGTITGAEFAEVLGVTNPTPVVNGCTMSYETINFDIGSCPVGNADAGPMDGGQSN